MSRISLWIVSFFSALLLTACGGGGGSPTEQFSGHWQGQCYTVHTYSQKNDINVTSDSTMVRTTHYYSHSGCHPENLGSTATIHYDYAITGTKLAPADPDGHSDTILSLDTNVTQSHLTQWALDGWYLPTPPEVGQSSSLQAQITDDSCAMLWAHSSVYTKDSEACNTHP